MTYISYISHIYNIWDILVHLYLVASQSKLSQCGIVVGVSFAMHRAKSQAQISEFQLIQETKDSESFRLKL